jgi:hypothetical protein
MKASRGSVTRSFVTSCCEGVHCAFVQFRVASNSRLELRRGACPQDRLPEWGRNSSVSCKGREKV